MATERGELVSIEERVRIEKVTGGESDERVYRMDGT